MQNSEKKFMTAGLVRNQHYLYYHQFESCGNSSIMHSQCHAMKIDGA